MYTKTEPSNIPEKKRSKVHDYERSNENKKEYS